MQLVVPKLSVPLLIGLSDFNSLNLVREKCDACLCTESFVTLSESHNNPDVQFYRNSDGTIKVTSSIFEKANILPWREKSRSHSEVELSIMDNLIQDMLSEGKLRKTDFNELLVVQEFILVDKF